MAAMNLGHASHDDPNSQKNWDAIWAAEGEDTWRTYPVMYGRIVQLVPTKSRVLDLGCGVGKLLDRLKEERDCTTFGVDISPVACAMALMRGHSTAAFTLTEASAGTIPFQTYDCTVAVEFLEHLETPVIEALLNAMKGSQAIFAVPNNCLGPDVEPQHKQQWTALEFKRLLQRFFPTVRVECVDDGAPRLIGVCGFPAKPYKLAFTMPVKNEGDDIERVLKSFRGACDVMVIGVDDQSTDATEAIAKQYADVVIPFTWENNFSKARNVCIDECRKHLDGPGDWIFMSEGHEHLEAGIDELLNLDQVPRSVHVVEVRREDRDHAWMFPWLFRNRDEIRFENPVHNVLVWNEEKAQSAQIPAIRTWHTRSHANASARVEQRRKMNRQELIKRLAENPGDDRSCYYLANEWRRDDPNRAIELYKRYLAMPGKNLPERYQARLSLTECLIKQVQEAADKLKTGVDAATEKQLRKAQQEGLTEVYNTLIVASADDWSRNEHWLYLGDLCFQQPDRLEQALRFYELAATSIGRAPLTFMWVEKSNYSWTPAMKLVTTYAAAGMLEEALHWCDRVKELLPEWAVKEAHDEVEAHRQAIITAKLEARS